jgi:CheY-like chemotaxis protein
MLNRTSEPERIGGSDRIPTWRVSLSENPDAEWRRQFLQAADASDILFDARITVAGAAIIFDLERPALAFACERIDEWIVHANGEPLAAPHVTTVLVVDDDAEVGPLARDVLESVGYVVLFTSDPLEAVRMARYRPGEIDLLLVDVIMPLMDGRELARRLLVIRPNVKVLLMSGYEVSGLKETGWPFIAKPFNITALAQKVADLVGRPLP